MVPNADHPLQSGLWAHLLRVQTQSEWTASLDCDKTQISRWVSGERPMSIDDWQVALITCRRRNRPDIADRVIAALVENLSGVAPAPVVSASPMAIAMTAAVNGGDTVRALQEALADGEISPKEAASLDELAAKHAKTARDLEALASEARAQRAMPRMGLAK